MKHLNKTIFATTLFSSLFLGQPLLAGEKGPHGEFASHAATSPQSEINSTHNSKHAHQEQASRSETGNPIGLDRVNFKLMHDHEDYLNQQFLGGKR